MRTNRILLALGALAVLGLIGATITLAVGMSRSERTRTGPSAGMMGDGLVGDGFGGMMSGAGGMMNGFGITPGGTATPVETSKDAARRVEAWLGDAGYDGFRVDEVMAFTNGYYASVEDASGDGAFELLVDPATGAVGPEPGPNMMWNTRYGMMGGRLGSSSMSQGMMGGMMGQGGMMNGAGTGGPVSEAEARSVADRWLERYSPGETAGTPRAYPGYYTLDTVRAGETVGMLSVNARTGAVWYHAWHGSFLEELEL